MIAVQKRNHYSRICRCSYTLEVYLQVPSFYARLLILDTSDRITYLPY